MGISENIADRRAAEQLLSCIDGEQRPRFWQELIELAKNRSPQNTPVRDVPTWYLNTLLDGLPWVKNLRRYSMSRRFRDRNAS